MRGRNSNNDLIRGKLGWDYEKTLEEGIAKTYFWIKGEMDKKRIRLYDDSCSTQTVM